MIWKCSPQHTLNTHTHHSPPPPAPAGRHSPCLSTTPSTHEEACRCDHVGGRVMCTRAYARTSVPTRPCESPSRRCRRHRLWPSCREALFPFLNELTLTLRLTVPRYVIAARSRGIRLLRRGVQSTWISEGTGPLRCLSLYTTRIIFLRASPLLTTSYAKSLSTSSS
jgi:hypothetical protein